MSIYPLARVWDHSRQRGTALLVLLAMADRADELGVVWAGAQWLAGRARVERRQIIRTVHWLESEGELIVMRARKPNGQTIVNHYIIATGASDELLSAAKRRARELLEIRGGVIDDTPEGVTHDTRGGVTGDTGGVSSATRGRVTPGHGGGDTVSPDPILDPEEEEVIFDPSSVWSLALQELAMQMTKPTFQSHLQSSTATRDGEVLVVALAERSREWVAERLDSVIRRAVEAAAGRPIDVRYVTNS